MSPRGKRDADTPFLSRSQVPAEKTAAEIQEILGRNGARRVMMEYEESEILALSFTIMIQGKEVLIRLPVRWRQYLKVLEQAWSKKSSRANPPTKEEAQRTAWRIAKTWLEAQLAMTQSGMVELQEVMLPYVVQGEQTLYERLAQTGFLLEHKP
jgi:hypothetical protein